MSDKIQKLEAKCDEFKAFFNSEFPEGMSWEEKKASDPCLDALAKFLWGTVGLKALKEAQRKA